MHITSAIAAAGFALFPLLAQAGVVYQWHTTNNETPWGVSLQLEFDQATVDRGAFSLDYYQSPGPDDTPQEGLLGMYYTTLNNPSSPLSYSAAHGGFSYGTGFISLDVQFVANGFLTGWIRTGDMSQHFEIASNGALFTFVDANNDGGLEGAGCPAWEPCSGATGYLQSRPAQLAQVAAVAEPASMGLLGLGAVGLLLARRRQTGR